jgi:hypothetical protein
MIAIFERKVRSGRGANRAVTKAQQANLDKRWVATVVQNVNVNFWFLRYCLKASLAQTTAGQQTRQQTTP